MALASAGTYASQHLTPDSNTISLILTVVALLTSNGIGLGREEAVVLRHVVPAVEIDDELASSAARVASTTAVRTDCSPAAAAAAVVRRCLSARHEQRRLGSGSGSARRLLAPATDTHALRRYVTATPLAPPAPPPAAAAAAAAAERAQHLLCSRAFQFGQKKFRFDSIRQSDKFAACTLIFK